ncbi:MAG: thioredoxin family protein [Armatimonadota bacterium]
MRFSLLGALTLIVLGLLHTMPAWANAPTPTVEGTYLGLSTGALRDARLVSLPQGTLLRAGAVTVTARQVAAEITKSKPELQAVLKTNQFFILEQLAIRQLLLAEARAWADSTKWPGKQPDERALLNAYLTGLAEKVIVTDDELRTFYESNKEMMGGATFDASAKDLRAYLLDEKQQQAIDRHVQTISARTAVEMDAAWMAAQAKTALDNPVDQARRAGKPALIEFGASGCGPCDMMAPIIDGLKHAYADQCTVLYIDVRVEQVLAARYGIQGIPVQVFFDKDGKEVFRHVGYFPKEKILEQFTALEIK